MRDVHNNVALQQCLDPVVATADKNGAGVDLQGYDGCELAALIGQSGDTLSSSAKIDIKIEESDDNSTFSAVTSADDVLGGTPDSSGIFATIDAATEDEAVYRIGYVGGKRYARITLDFTGTHSNGTPVAILAVKGRPAMAPAS